MGVPCLAVRRDDVVRLTGSARRTTQDARPRGGFAPGSAADPDGVPPRWRWRAPSAAQDMLARVPGMSSLVLRLQRVPRAVIDAGLAVGLAVAITIAIGVSPEPGARHDPAAYVLGWTIAALVLVRRRWPLAVLLASAIILQLYYELDYPGIYPAVPLSIALATAWAAGHRLWSLLVAGLFVAAGVGVGYQALAPNQPALQVLGDVTRDLVLFAAVLLLGEAVRTRRALQREKERSERLLLNVLPAPIATRLEEQEDVIADAFPEVTVLFADLVDFTRRSQRSSPQQVVQVLDELFTAFDRLTRRHGLRRSRPSVTPTWWPAGCRSRGPTTPRRWPTSPWPCEWRWPGVATPAAGRFRCASASTSARW